MTHRIMAAQGDPPDRSQRPADDNRQGQQSGGAGREDSRESSEESSRKRARPETLPPSTTSGGLPSEPGWMRP